MYIAAELTNALRGTGPTRGRRPEFATPRRPSLLWLLLEGNAKEHRMPSSVESEIHSRLESFVQDLTSLIRESAMELVSEALGDRGSSRRGGARRAAGAAPSTRPTKGAKRDPKVLAALTEKLGAFIKKTPGQRIEQIGKALGTPTKELALPVKKLISAKKISTKGQKRATTYFPR